jgi:ABC-type polysaccharide/polyol phosphate transport system ATPase subunit
MCRTLKSFRESGATVLLVAHPVNTIRSLCQKAVLLDHAFPAMDLLSNRLPES